MNDLSKYQTRRFEVDAIRYMDSNVSQIEDFARADAKVRGCFMPGPGRGISEGLLVETLEGRHFLKQGQWLVRDPDRMYMVLDHEHFEARFETIHSEATRE